MLKACLLVVLLCGVASAGENYMYIPEDPPTCNKVSFSIDEMWNKLNLSIGACTLNTNRDMLARGYFFTCASTTGEASIVVYRSKKACLTHILLSKTNVVSPLTDLAPAGAKNALLWAETLQRQFASLPDAELQAAVDKKMLQPRIDILECSALKISNFISGGGLHALIDKNPKATLEEKSKMVKEIGNAFVQKCIDEVVKQNR